MRMTTDEASKIYALCYDSGGWSGDLTGLALDEDGYVIASHISSGMGWSEHDMVSSGWKDEKYSERYPDGWEVMWLGKAPSDWIDHLPDDLADKCRALAEKEAAK